VALRDYVSIYEAEDQSALPPRGPTEVLSRLRLLEQAASDAYNRWIECVEAKGAG
jgi:hypothetical protein